MMGKAARECHSRPTKGEPSIYRVRTVLGPIRELRLQGAQRTECYRAPSLQESQTPQLSCLAELREKSAKMLTDLSRAGVGWHRGLECLGGPGAGSGPAHTLFSTRHCRCSGDSAQDGIDRLTSPDPPFMGSESLKPLGEA